MVRSISLGFCISLLLTLSVAKSQLTTPEEARDLALRLLTGVVQGVKPDIYSKLSHVHEAFQRGVNEALEKYASLRSMSMIDRIENVGKNIFRVDQAYNTMAKFLKSPESLSDDLKEEFAMGVAIIPAEFKIILAEIQEALLNGGLLRHPSIFQILAHNEDPESNCVTGESSEKLINKLYESIVLTEVEGLVVQLQVVDFKKLSDNMKEYSKKRVTDEFLDRVSHMFDEVKAALVDASKLVSECHPSEQ